MASKRSSLKPLASIAFKEQSGCCIYCDKPMWLNDPESVHPAIQANPKAGSTTSMHRGASFST